MPSNVLIDSLATHLFSGAAKVCQKCNWTKALVLNTGYNCLQARYFLKPVEKKEGERKMNLEPFVLPKFYSDPNRQTATEFGGGFPVGEVLPKPVQSKEDLLKNLKAASRRISLLCMGYRESSPYFKQAMKPESEQPICDVDWD